MQSMKFLILQLILIIIQTQGVFCTTSPAKPRDSEVALRSTIFDSRVLHEVKKIFTQNSKTIPDSDERTGEKKSKIAGTESGLHVKIDPRLFGAALLNKANENAARKSDIYMNRAIDATALGVAVLKLIFGKDAKMVMKDARPEDQVNLRMKEEIPKITSWASEKGETADKKSLKEENSNGHEKMIYKNEREKNLMRLLSLVEESKKETVRGDKKSWVLLKVPSKQPKEELGMLTDPNEVVEYSHERHDDISTNDNESMHKPVTTFQERRKLRQQNRNKEKSQGLVSKIQDQVKHLAELMKKQNEKRHKDTKKKHDGSETTQSNERNSLMTSRRVWAKTLKSEPVEEVNAVKTDETNYDNSVRNLLHALETSAEKHTLKHVSKNEGKTKENHQPFHLVPSRNKEEQASSKDVVNGGNTGGAVVSLDALRQLGQLLGLSSQQSEEKRISPYTGTQDTLTLASPMPPGSLQNIETTPATQVSPTVPPDTNVLPENNLNRISEELKMFAERGLRSHNDYRSLHHAEPLKWSEELASAAEKLAYQAAKKGSTRRSELIEKKGYGENVVKISNIALESAGEEATRHWYNEKQNFTFSDPVIDDGTKAFTQMIWKGTKTLGMGAAKDDDTGELYIVALYSPKGNDQEILRENLAAEGQENTDVYASIFKKSTAPRALH